MNYMYPTGPLPYGSLLEQALDSVPSPWFPGHGVSVLQPWHGAEMYAPLACYVSKHI